MLRALIEQVSGYPGLFLFCLCSGLLLPLPEDIPLLYAGTRVQAGELQWAPTIAVALVGVLLRDIAAYGIGRFVGEWFLSRPSVVRLIGVKRLQRARDLVALRGSSAVFAGRFLVGLRAPIFLVAGAMGVSFRRFLVWNLLGLLLVVPGTLVLGFAFGPPLADGAFWVVRQGRGVMGGVALVVVGLTLLRWRAMQVAGAAASRVAPQTDLDDSRD